MSCVMSSAIFGFERTPTISPSSATIWAGRARRVGARDHAIFGDLQACLHTSASCARHLERRLVQEGCAHEERGWSERGKRGREGCWESTHPKRSGENSIVAAATQLGAPTQEPEKYFRVSL